MKNDRYLIFLIIWIFSISTSVAQTATFNNLYGDLLNKIVIDQKVDYTYCSQHIAKIDSALYYASQNFNNSSKKQDLSLLINYYNLSVIRGIASNYPVSSPNDIPSFFDKSNIHFGDKLISLNSLEEEIFKSYPDPRIHFALVCAALSCPPLKDQPFTEQKLENDLDSISHQVFSNSKIFTMEESSNEIKISKIFEWYAHHFNGKKGVLEFIESHHGKLPDGVKVSYLPYNWSLNDYTRIPTSSESFQQFTPSYLLGKNRLEIKTFINLYSQNKRFDDDFNKLDESLRQTYFTNITEFLYGLSNRLSVGGEIWYKSVYVDSNRNSSPFELFSEWAGTKKGLTGIGPRIKFTPFERVQNLSLQSTFLFQPTEDPQGISDQSNFLDFNRNLWINTLYFDKSLHQDYSLFFRISAWYSLIDDGDNFLETPFAVFVNYFPTTRWTIYFQNELWMKHVNKSFSSFFNQTGLGTKYQVIRKYLELEILYTNFVLGSEGEGAGETFNLGLRFIR